jgi:hypothetical protein
MPFGSLWIPVLVSAVVVFVGSSILHMALKYHKTDHKPLPNEEAVSAALAKGNLAPGIYSTPYCSDMGKMKDPAMQAKFAKGPVVIMTVFPSGMPNMGKHLGLWFGYTVLVSFVSAYVARHTLHPGADPMQVTQVTGMVAFAAYGVSQLSDAIWKGQPWGVTARFVLDGAIYAVLTALTFRMLWPAVHLLG